MNKADELRNGADKVPAILCRGEAVLNPSGGLIRRTCGMRLLRRILALREAWRRCWARSV